MSHSGYHVLADVVLIVYGSFILFVVVGLLLIVVGWIVRWHWARNFWFRLLHVLAIAVVVGLTWCDTVCPLTALESQLRERAGEAGYTKSFVATWLHRFFYHDLPQWVFVACYTGFGALVLFMLVLVRPNRPFTGKVSRLPQSSNSKRDACCTATAESNNNPI